MYRYGKSSYRTKMGSERKRFQCEATGLGSSHGLRLRLQKCWQTRKWSVLKCAPISIAAGFSTIRPRPGLSVGATTEPAVTAPASAARGYGNEKPDEETRVIARPAVHSVELNLGILAANEREKLVASLLIVTEGPEHGASHGRTVLLLHAAHLHTQMASFDDYADALRSDFFLDGLRDLAGHALLNLQAARKHIDHASDLAEPQNPLVRQIGHMGLAEERQQMVFAETEEFDVLHDDHLVVGHAERRAIQYMIQVQVVTAGQILESFLETLRRLAQPFAIRVLSDDLDDLAHVASDGARVEFLAVIQKNFFRWLRHGRFPSRLSPAYSKLLFPVSWTRIRSSFALGKVFKRRKISMHKFSVVGTFSRNAGTSSLSDL